MRRRSARSASSFAHAGITVPLVADIHFSPAAAMEAANHVEKVRINPGNFADSRQFAVREYTDLEYEQELERIEERFTPLVLKCKSLGVAMRVGTNHGSLSDRIMNRFGDTPLGMVESALEFLRICQKNDYPDVILSMKASNPKVMIQAYRLLVARMDEIGMTFPLHLGVTEAGNDEDGRIKSAVGIGVAAGRRPRRHDPRLADRGAGGRDPGRRAAGGAVPGARRARGSSTAADPRETRDPYAFARRLSTESGGRCLDASAGARRCGCSRRSRRPLPTAHRATWSSAASDWRRPPGQERRRPTPSSFQADTAEQRADVRQSSAARLAAEAPTVERGGAADAGRRAARRRPLADAQVDPLGLAGRRAVRSRCCAPSRPASGR